MQRFEVSIRETNMTVANISLQRSVTSSFKKEKNNCRHFRHMRGKVTLEGHLHVSNTLRLYYRVA